MKALLLTLMFLISMTAFSQQKSSREDGLTVLKDSSTILKDSSIVVTNDSLMFSQSILIDHNALAKKYKSTSTFYGITAAVFGAGFVGCCKYISDNLFSDSAENAAVIGAVCLGAAIGCTIAAVVYHYKAGKQLKLSVKGTSASLVYTF